MKGHIVRSVNFLEGGAVSVEYVTPELDVKANGMVVNHGLLVPPTDEFDDDLNLLLRTCQKFLADALRAFEASPSATTEDLELPYGENEPAPYDNPYDPKDPDV